MRKETGMAIPNFEARERLEKQGFQGYVQGISLQTVVQMIEIEKRSCTVFAYAEDHEGRLGFSEGRLVEAEAGGLQGEPAAYEILGWTSTDVELRDFDPLRPRQLDDLVSRVLIDRLRRDDEANRATREFPQLFLVGAVEEEPFTPVGELSFGGSRFGAREEEPMMSNLQKVLESFRGEVPEFVSTDIVNVDSGLSIGGGSIDPDFDASIAAASYAEVVKANRRALELLGQGMTSTEDILITTEKVYILIRPMGNDYYHVLAVGRRGNLGLARAIMKKYEPKLLAAVGDLS
jgi:predicted regulator of Ras-like GTPase activity (Roadblock/LC7/MglB family)